MKSPKLDKGTPSQKVSAFSDGREMRKTFICCFVEPSQSWSKCRIILAEANAAAYKPKKAKWRGPKCENHQNCRWTIKIDKFGPFWSSKQVLIDSQGAAAKALQKLPHKRLQIDFFKRTNCRLEHLQVATSLQVRSAVWFQLINIYNVKHERSPLSLAHCKVLAPHTKVAHKRPQFAIC